MTAVRAIHVLVITAIVGTFAVSPARAAGPAAGTAAEAHAFATWRAEAGTLVLELDPAALARAGVAGLVNADGTPSDGSFVFEVAAADSDFQLVTRDGEPERMSGFLQSRGRFTMPLPNGLSTHDGVVGDFIIMLTSQGAWMNDQASTFRTIFEMNANEIAVSVDEATESLVITASVVIGESFAQEVMRDPSVAGMVVGNMVIDAAISMTGIDVPQMTPPDDGASPRGGTGNGPDVIVHQIGSSLDEYGPVGDITAYAMTTVSCNLGDADAIWIDCTSGSQCNQHPVIVQNMFRLKSGRFEHIGLAWLKHGWCAADANGCGSPYEPVGSCDWLGTHATDTYGAGLNAAQDDLGPRSDINAWSGVFVYPYSIAWNQTGNAIYKRLQIKNDDVNPALNAGATYFGESQYVATDEQPINRYNNCTYRRAVVGAPFGAGWRMDFTDSSITQQPGINAWAANESGVTLVPIDVPSDGRLILGYKVTDLGGGTWHYEYALYNMNSHRSVQAFNVPVDAEVVVSNIGFHDVDYHSGEIFSLTDWPGTHTGDVLSWETQTFAVNANANALRWSTLYNFRFDANVPPEPGTIDLPLFRTGSPASVSVAASVPSVPFCGCDGDLDGSGTPDGLDLQVFTEMFMGNLPVSNCADVSTPAGPLDMADLSKFVDKVLEGICPE